MIESCESMIDEQHNSSIVNKHSKLKIKTLLQNAPRVVDKFEQLLKVKEKQRGEAKFVIENKTNGRNSYSIRFFDSKGNLVLRANFVRMYDSSNTLIQERLLAYERIFAKYGKKQNLVLRATKEIDHY
jgi:hypothetical protein